MELTAATNRIRYTWAFGQRYVHLRDVAKYYGMKVVLAKGSCELRSAYSRLIFNYNKRNGSLNGVKVHYHFSPFLRGVSPMISEKDFLLVIDPFLRYKSLKKHRLRTIMIDPGHGGKDNGAKGLKNLEKNLTLQMARKLRAVLIRKGYRVLMTRNSDYFLTLTQRTDKARKQQADLFISIHCNAAGNRSVGGVESFCLTPLGTPSTSDKKPEKRLVKGNANDKNNFRLALEIHRSLVPATGSRDRGVKHARFAVLRQAHCPAVLVETGFLSNRSEEKKLSSHWRQNKIVKAIAEGISKYHRELRRK